jgi:hypothetical protein
VTLVVQTRPRLPAVPPGDMYTDHTKQACYVTFLGQFEPALANDPTERLVSQRDDRTFEASVLDNSPAFSSTITVSMVSSVAIMTKRCVERNASNVSENQGEIHARICYLCTRSPKGASAIHKKAKPRNKERLVVSDKADGCF